MNIHEGAKRMKRAGQVIFFIATSLTLLLILYPLGFQMLYPSMRPWFSSTALLILTFVFVIPGVILWICGWILEGFSSKRGS
jgi:hypothetical protein